MQYTPVSVIQISSWEANLTGLVTLPLRECVLKSVLIIMQSQLSETDFLLL
jgi:hypothetical protein